MIEKLLKGLSVEQLAELKKEIKLGNLDDIIDERINELFKHNHPFEHKPGDVLLFNDRYGCKYLVKVLKLDAERGVVCERYYINNGLGRLCYNDRIYYPWDCFRDITNKNEFKIVEIREYNPLVWDSIAELYIKMNRDIGNIYADTIQQCNAKIPNFQI